MGRASALPSEGECMSNLWDRMSGMEKGMAVSGLALVMFVVIAFALTY